MSYRYYQTKKCHQCRTEFKAIRSDAKYCSTKCRKAADRKRRQLRVLFDGAMSSIKVLLAYTDHQDFGKDVKQYLSEIGANFAVTDNVPGQLPPGKIGQPLRPNVPTLAGTNQAEEAVSGYDLPLSGKDTSSPVDLSVTFMSEATRLRNVEHLLHSTIERVDALDEAFEAIAG